MSRLSPPTVSPPLFECSDEIFVSGQFRGADVAIFTHGDPNPIAQGTAASASQPFGIRPDVHLKVGMRVWAVQQYQGETSDTDPALYSVQVEAAPPIVRPDIVGPIFTCGGCTRLDNVIQGARVTVGVNKSGTFEERGSGGAALGFPGTGPGEILLAHQELCGTLSADSSYGYPAVLPPEGDGTLPKPVVQSPLYCGPSASISNLVVGAQVTLERSSGLPGGPFCAIAESMTCPVSPDFSAGESVTVRQEFPPCHPDVLHLPPPGVSDPVTVLPITQDVIPVPIVFPLCMGDAQAYVSNLELGAEVSIYAGDEQVGWAEASQSSLLFNLTRRLSEGEKVHAVQEICQTLSRPSAEVEVWTGYRDLPTPVIPNDFIECGGLVHVKNVLPGTWVEIVSQLTEPHPIGSVPVLGAENEVDVPLYRGLSVQDGVIWAVIKGCGGFQAKSNDAKVHAMAALPKPVIECAIANQTWIKVSHIAPGALVDVFLDDVPLSGRYIVAETAIISGLPPLKYEHKIKVCQRACAVAPACSDEHIVLRQFPRYNQVYGAGSHNSYWINRSDNYDYYASGPQELLSDQLLHEHVRTIEIDVHSDGAPAGQWKVYHTSDSENFTGRYLEDYLEYLRNFQYAVPQHEVINVVIELKNIYPPGGGGASHTLDPTTPNFDEQHTMDEFDETIRRYLGPWLYTPADFLAPAPWGTSLVEWARISEWPTIDELRGRFIIMVIGGWSTAAVDWIKYATTNLEKRAAFPMQSIFDVSPTLPPDKSDKVYFQVTMAGMSFWISDVVTSLYPVPDEIGSLDRQAAFDASIFWDFAAVHLLANVNSVASQIVTTFLQRNGLIRGGDAFRFNENDRSASDNDAPEVKQNYQEFLLEKGFQMIVTDYPWHILNDEAAPALGIPTDPSRRLRDESWKNGPPTHFSEVGTRFYFHADPLQSISAYTTVPDVSQRWWEVTVSTTRAGGTALARTDPAGVPDHALPIIHHVPLSFPRRAQDFGYGGIVAWSMDWGDQIRIVREKTNPQPPDPNQKQETVSIHIQVFKGGFLVEEKSFVAARLGPCKRPEDPTDLLARDLTGDVSDVCVGNMIALSIDNINGQSFVNAYSAGKMKSSEMPDWQWLGSWTFDQPLRKQGFISHLDVMLAGPRMAYAFPQKLIILNPPPDIRLQDLPDQVAFGDPSKARFVDLSWSVFDECTI